MAIIETKTMTPIKWTEKIAQAELAFFCRVRNHDLIIPNFQSFPYFENDLVSVTKAGLSHVFEIKCSRSDFLYEFGHGRATGNKLARLRLYERRDPQGANYFWVVCPASILKSYDEIPPWAGIITLPNEYSAAYGDRWRSLHRVIRPAPRLHSEKIKSSTITKIGRGLGIRYWRRVLAGHLNRTDDV